MRLDIAVERGHGDRYYAQMASEHHMDRLQVEVVKLNDELAEILNEADYMKEKEARRRVDHQGLSVLTLLPRRASRSGSSLSSL